MTAFSADDLFAHSDALRRLARDLVADEALADDAVQQAYVVALTRPPRELSSLAGWLRAVVRTCSLDLLRQQGRRRRREQQVEPPLPLAPDEAAVRLELQAAIAAAVRGLGEPYGSVVWLRWFEGLSPSEIAARQGEPVKTIKTRLGRALQLLRSKLDGRPGGRDAWLAALAPLVQLPVARTGASAAVAGGGAGVLVLPKLFGAVLVACAMLVAGVWLWRSVAIPTDAAGSKGIAVAARAGEVGRAAGALPSAASSRGRTDAAAKRADDVSPQRREAEPLAASGPSVQLLVRGIDRVPVSDVDVFYGMPAAVAAAAAASDLEVGKRLRLTWDPVGWYGTFGERVRTDARGIAQWAWSDRQGTDRFWLCVVQHGGDYGELWLSRSAAPEVVHELQLQRDRNCAVRVLDAQHQPVAGVPVAATFRAREVDGRRGREELGQTDDDGWAQVRHVQTWSDRIAPRGSALPAAITIDLPGIEVAQQIDADALPEQPMVLFLPPSGWLRITVLDAAGAPVVGEKWVLREHEGASDRAFRVTTDSTGVADFPRVALGRSWQVYRDGVPPESPPIVIGPRVPGERVDVHQQPDPVPVLLGRLVQQGQPLAATVVTIKATAAGRELPSLRGTTDGDGCFAVPCSAGWRNQRLQELRIYPFAPAEGDTGTCATWRGECDLTAGSHELGSLVLEPEPIVVAGQLVAPAGVPLPPDVDLRVEVATEAAIEAWRFVSLRGRLRPDGAFALFGSVPSGAMRLVVTTANRFVPVPPRRFRAGDRDLRIELQHGGSVRSSVIAESRIAASCQVLLLVPTNAEHSLTGAGLFSSELDARMARESGFVSHAPWEKEFVWPAVAPGRYRVEVWARGLHRPLHVVSDVVVADGQRNAEPRLQQIAVPGIRTIVITLPQATTARRLPERIGVGVIGVLEGDRPADLCWQVENATVMFATVQPLDVLVRLNGFRDRIVRGVVADQAIELEPGIPVRLRAEGYQVPAGHTLRLELTAVDDVLARAQPQLYSAAAGGSIPGYQRMSMAADCAAGAASLQLPAPGRHQLTASLRDAAGAVSALALEPAELVIGAAGGTFEVQIRGAR
ncbi:MAG: sigma-70 family RNA polymerase sigma factor [Planctomycetes bacterium]|jgi:RNA polymerase sigma-70 factor (ECF subfamily)|nr:sigma-70 family RNA polymerase sigma factor [Planctomycetota bacterium]